VRALGELAADLVEPAAVVGDERAQASSWATSRGGAPARSIAAAASSARSAAAARSRSPAA
jgi:hypothetical protein